MGASSNIETGNLTAVSANRRSVFFAPIIFVILALTSCSGSNEPEIVMNDTEAPQSDVVVEQASRPAGAVVESANQDDDSSSDEPSAPSLALIASPNADSLQESAGQLAAASIPASQFLADADGSRLDQLGDSICSELPDEPTVDGVTTTGLQTYDETLSEDERESLGRDDWAVAFAAIVLTYCPDQFPPTPTGARLPLIDQYRVIDPTNTLLPEETIDFIQASSDQRLDQLQRSACSDVNPEMDLQSLEVAIATSYEELTEDEKARLTPSGYGQLYLDLVGFFCFENVPQ